MSRGGQRAAPERFHGVVLAGGRSRRFGSDKRLASVGGRRMLDSAIERLAAVVTGELFLAVAEHSGVFAAGRPAAARAGAVWVVDAPAGCGPLGGMIAAMARSGSGGLLVLACDLPAVRPSTLRSIARLGLGSGRAVAPLGSRGWEPLAAFYPRACLGRLLAAARAGVYAPHRILESSAALPWRGWTPGEFHNVNRPVDLETLRR